jgi:hypothetical protein
MTNPAQFFTCEKCDRRYAYLPAMAGKKMRCKCGYVFVPQVAKFVEALPDEYDLEPDMPAAAKPAAPLGAEPVPVNPVLAYAHKRPVPQAEQELESVSKIKNLYVPIALIVLGLGMRGAQLFLPSAGGHSIAVMILAMIGAVILNVILMFCGVLIASRVLDADFGAIKWAVIKLAAMSIVGGAATSMIISMDYKQGGIQGPLIALHVLILVYFIGFSTFFEIDLQEALFTVVIVMLFQTGAFCIASAQFT